ncbi:Cytoskeleton associated protein 5, partial [Cladochytrium tenue]
VGDNKETMRAKIRGIMRQSCRVFPASKLFVFILDGLKSKNARTRAECLEELGDLIKRNGMAVCGASNGAKAMPLIAAQISDGDAKVRNAALVAIGQAYQLVGDTVYKLVGRLSDKERSMLEEKLRRMPPPPSAAPPPEPAEPKAPRLPPGMVRSTAPVVAPEEPPVPVAREDFRRDFSLDLDKLKATHRLSVSQKSDYMAYQSEALASPNPTGDGNHTSGTSLLLDFVVTQITSGEVDQSIDALKQLERYLVSGGNSPGFTPDPVLLEHLDDAVSAITLQIRIAFTSASPATSGPFARLSKHLIGSLVQIFSSGAFAKAVGPEALARCIRELLTRLLDPRFANNAEGSDGQLSRALNVLMVRVLENGDKNLLFSVASQVKFTELIMKCIWKMTKVIPQLIEQGSLNVSELLFTVHTFLKNTPPVEWKRRAAEKITPQADMPLRTVKTILHELVAELGDQVMDNIGMIEDPGRSATVTYLKQMIESGRRKNGQPAANSASPPAVQTDGGARMSDRSSPPAAATSGYEPVVRQQPKSLAQRSPRTAGLTEEEADMQLTVVFSRIGQKDETKQGIADLHDFRKRHPEHEDLVQKHLLRTGSYFQGYIRRGLASLASAEEEREQIERQLGARAAAAGPQAVPLSPPPTFSGIPRLPSSSSVDRRRSAEASQAAAAAASMEYRASMEIPPPAISAAPTNADSAEAYKASLARLQQRLSFMAMSRPDLAGMATAAPQPLEPVVVDPPSPVRAGNRASALSGLPQSTSSLSPPSSPPLNGVPYARASSLAAAAPAASLGYRRGPAAEDETAGFDRLGAQAAAPAGFRGLAGAGAGGMPSPRLERGIAEFRQRLGMAVEQMHSAPASVTSSASGLGAEESNGATMRPTTQTVEQLKMRLAAMKASSTTAAATAAAGQPSDC